MFPPFDSLLRLVGAVRCDQNDTRLSATSFIDRRTLEAGYRREALPEGLRGSRGAWGKLSTGS